MKACLLGERDGASDETQYGERVCERLADLLDLLVVVNCFRADVDLHLLSASASPDRRAIRRCDVRGTLRPERKLKHDPYKGSLQCRTEPRCEQGRAPPLLARVRRQVLQSR